MHLVQILLPLADNDGQPFPHALFAAVRAELADRYGGITVYRRAPAEGLWCDDGQATRDDVAIYEVMVEALDRNWWADYRAGLEVRFRQDEVVVRAVPVERL